MHRVTRAILAAACVASLVLALNATTRVERAVPGGIQVTPALVNFDVLVLDGNAYRKTIRVKNDDGKPVTIGAQWDCGCIRVEPAQAEIPSGATQIFTVEARPKRATDNLHATVFFKDLKTSKIVSQARVTGEVLAAIQCDRQTVQIEVLEGTAAAEAVLSVKNTQPQRIEGRVVSIGDAAPMLRMATDQFSLEPGETGLVHVAATFPGDRRVRGRIALMGESQTASLAEVDVVVTGKPNLMVQPASIIVRGTQGIETVSLARRDQHAFTIVDVEIPSDLPVVFNLQDSQTAASSHSVTFMAGATQVANARGDAVLTVVDSSGVKSTLAIPIFVVAQ